MAEVLGKSTLLKNGSTTIGQVVSISGPSWSVGTIETTLLASTNKTYLQGLPDGGEVSAVIQYDPADSSQQILTGLMATPAVSTWSITFTDAGAAVYAFSGILTGFEIGGMEQESIVTANISIKLTGAITITP